MAIASETRKLTMKTTKIIDSVELFVFASIMCICGRLFAVVWAYRGLDLFCMSSRAVALLSHHLGIYFCISEHFILLNLLVLVTIDPLYLVILRGFCSSNSVKISRLSSYARRYLQYESA